MKNVVRLNHFYHPEGLIETLEKFVNNYNTKRYRESLNNLTLADVYFGRAEQTLEKRKQIKEDHLHEEYSNYKVHGFNRKNTKDF